jgi:hypothetical protein
LFKLQEKTKPEDKIQRAKLEESKTIQRLREQQKIFNDFTLIKREKEDRKAPSKVEPHYSSESEDEDY